ncbi:hypothetical protein MYAM1_000213 [Malassezia yamatoensis]|uniref:MHD domain-containing protein n=1 Tax=Malassezia yamatoensis TaxID=253288 RepID=A0AAJ6CFA4_9BASI|nr:hypothetical protein MYAM1_000213 [Malassezia yamatoensis]
MDGLILLGRAGQPLIQTRFQQHRSAYPLLHIDFLNSTLRDLRSQGKENAIPPILSVPVAEDVLVSGSVSGTSSDSELDSDEQQDSLLSDQEESESDTEDIQKETNVWENTPTSSADASHQQAATMSEQKSWQDDGPVQSTQQDLEEEPVQTLSVNHKEAGAVLFHIKVGELRLLCPVSHHVDPLVPLSFLHQVAKVLQIYLIGNDTEPNKMTEELVTEHFDTVYQLLEEMLDGDGNVLLTELNILREIVLPPSWLDRLVATVGLGSALDRSRPTLKSPVPWRKSESKYNKEEFFVDFVEKLEAIVQPSGKLVTMDFTGEILASASLNGMPEVVMPLTQPSIIQDCAWHPCIRQKKWNSSQVLSFIPPDGTSVLGNYRLVTQIPSSTGVQRFSKANNQPLIPVFLTADLEDWDAQHGTRRFRIALESRTSAHHSLSDLAIEWSLGEFAQGVDASERKAGSSLSAQNSSSSSSHEPNSGSGESQSVDAVIFDRRKHVLRWKPGSLDSSSRIELQGNILSHAAPCQPLYALKIHYTILGHTQTNLRAREIQLSQSGANPPVKGVRNTTKGTIEWRR